MKALTVLTAVFGMAMLFAVVYHIGELSGRGQLDRWMREQSVHKFVKIEDVCPPGQKVTEVTLP